MNDNKYSILYVDDEEINLRIFNSTFRRKFEIFTADSGKEGLKILKTNEIDIIITDQRMPNMTGVEFLKEVQILFPSIPPRRLIISGYSDHEDIQEAFRKYQLFRFISKPWDEENVLEIINNSLSAQNDG